LRTLIPFTKLKKEFLIDEMILNFLRNLSNNKNVDKKELCVVLYNTIGFMRNYSPFFEDDSINEVRILNLYMIFIKIIN